MFALLQSKRWEQQTDQQMIIEFLTQIIYSEPCQLFLGFKDGEPVAAAIVTLSNAELLVSDLYVDPSVNQNSFVCALIEKVTQSTEMPLNSDAYLEI